MKMMCSFFLLVCDIKTSKMCKMRCLEVSQLDCGVSKLRKWCVIHCSCHRLLQQIVKESSSLINASTVMQGFVTLSVCVNMYQPFMSKSVSSVLFLDALVPTVTREHFVLTWLCIRLRLINIGGRLWWKFMPECSIANICSL